MEGLTREQQEILLHIHQIQHDQSLSHRQSIFNAFSLALAGLMALMAGALAPGKMSLGLKIPVSTAVVAACVIIIIYIHRQRESSERAMGIIRAIDKRLDLFEPNEYLPGKSVLPETYACPQPKWGGFSTRIDVWLVSALVVLSGAVIGIVWALPTP